MIAHLQHAITRLTYAVGVADTLVTVHALGIVHCDLKDDNVLLLDNVACLVDFGGCVRLQPGQLTGLPGAHTTKWAPPEMMIQKKGHVTFSSPASDVFSLGLLVIDILRGSDKVLGILCTGRFLPFLMRMINPVAAKRPTSTEAHTFLSEMLHILTVALEEKDTQIPEMVLRHADIDDPCRSDYKHWTAMAEFLDRRGDLAGSVKEENFNLEFKATFVPGFMVLPFLTAGWAVTDFLGYLCSAVYSINHNISEYKVKLHGVGPALMRASKSVKVDKGVYSVSVTPALK